MVCSWRNGIYYVLVLLMCCYGTIPPYGAYGMAHQEDGMMFRRRIAQILAAALITLSLAIGFTASVNRTHTASYTNAVALNPNPPEDPELSPTPARPPHVIDGG
jgi:hypothetical protein